MESFPVAKGTPAPKPSLGTSPWQPRGWMVTLASGAARRVKSLRSALLFAKATGI